jgi:uncharacterized protein YcfL
MRTPLPCLLLLLVVAAGCVNNSETVSTPYPPVERQTVYDKHVVIDPTLRGVIRVVGVKSITGPDGFLKVQVNVQSLLNSGREIQYRITWFDANGTELPMAGSSLMTWMFLPHETSFLAAAAPTPSARDFRVDFPATAAR